MNLRKRLLAYLLTFAMVLSLLPQTTHAADGSNTQEPQAHVHQHEFTVAAPEANAPANPVKAEGTTVLAFTSDVHNCFKNGTTRPNDNMSAARLGTWIDKVEAIHGDIDVMAFGGDMANASASATEFWSLTQNDLSMLAEKGVNGVLTTGNHEHSPGKYSASSTDTTQQVYKINTEAAVGDDYRIYCLGSVSSSSSYSTQYNSLDEYLKGVGNDKPIFIITHFPLHYYKGTYMNRTTTDADKVINVLNDAVDRGQMIVYLWGHNHTESDTYYDQIYGPGTSIPYSSSQSKDIKFYYGAAGCMSDSEYGDGSGFVKGKGLIVTINKNRGNATMAFTYYDADGKDVTETASVKSVDVTVRSTTTYVPATELVEGGEYLIANGNTGEVRIITNEAGSASQSLKGVAATVSDGKITIDEDTVAKAVFTVELETSDPESIRLKNGEKYLYSDSSNGLRMHALTSSESTKWWHYNSDDALLWFFKGTSNNYGYTDNTVTYKYYLTVNDAGEFVAGHTANSGNQMQLSYCDTPEMYLFVKGGSNSGGDDPVDPQTGKTIDITPASSNSPEESVSINVGETLTINVTNGSSSNAYDFTATLNNSNVAEIQGNATLNIVASGTGTFTVKGLASGTADITISNGNNSYSRKGTIHLMVKGSGGDEPATLSRFQKVDAFTNGKKYLIVSSDAAGSAYAIKNPGGSADGSSLTSTAVTIQTGQIIETNVSDIVWTATANSSVTNGFDLTNGSDYLDGKGGNVKSFNPTAYADRCWTYDGTHLEYKGGSYTYELYLDGSTVSYRNYNSGGATHQIYIFEEVDSTPVAVTGVELDKATATVNVDKTVQLTATVAPSNATNQNVTWSSSDSGIATVNETGKVTGVAVGTATITVTTEDGNFTDTCDITVEEATQAYYVITIGNYAMSSNASDDVLVNSGSGTQQYNYHGLDGVVYSANDPAPTSILWTIEPVSGTTNGYYIKSYDGKSLSATYASNSTGGSDGNLTVGDTQDVWTISGGLDTWMVSGSTLKSTNAGKSITHEEGTTSSPLNLFTVRSTGETTTLVEAEEIIEPVAVESITLDPTSLSVEAGKTSDTITVNILPSDATNKNVTWSSSNENVATVSGGVVTGVAAGTATITVTTEDGGFTATCVVTVTAPQVDRYVKVNSIKAGGEYIITNNADVGADTTRALKNPGGTSSGVQISSSNGKTTVMILEGSIIKTDDTAIVWTAETNGEGFNLVNDGSYLEIQSRALKVYKPLNQAARYWTYTNNQLVHNGGSSTYYVTYGSGTFSGGTTSGNVYFFEKIEDTPHEHSYGTLEYTWTATDTGYTCTATAVCTSCEEGTEGHTVTETVTANYAVTTAATCMTPGSGIYTATFTNALFAEQTKPVEIPLAAHTLEHHAATAASCTEDGNIEYWFCTVCEKYFSDAEGTAEITQPQTIVAHSGHAYGDPVWSWNGVASATAVFTCTNCNDEQTVTDSDISSAEGTDENVGHTVYTAEVEFGGQPYTDTKVAINQYTLTFKDGDTVVGTITKNYGEAISEAEIPAVPTRAFYTGVWGEVPETMPAEDMIISVQWTAYEGYYLVGINGDWTANEAYEFKANPANPSEYMLSSVILTEGTELKAIKAVGGVDTTWYPAGTGNNYVVDTDHAGTVTVYFSRNTSQIG